MKTKGSLHPIGGGKQDPYKPDTVLFDSTTAGTYRLTVMPGFYSLTMTGPGGRGGTSYRASSKLGLQGGGGSSGAGFRGYMQITKKTGLVLQVGKASDENNTNNGATDTFIQGLIVCGFGGFGQPAGGYVSYSVPGKLTLQNLIIAGTPQVARDGIKGSISNDSNHAHSLGNGSPSVLTNSGGGIAFGGSATEPGAGGACAYWDSGQSTGKGGPGWIQLIYKKLRPIYYKYSYSSWQQPNLTANGTVGGNSYAARACGEWDGNQQAWRAFDGNNSTNWADSHNDSAGAFLEFYSPVVLRVTAIKFRNRSQYIKVWGNGVIKGSFDGVNYFNIQTFTNTNQTANAEWTINISSPVRVKYIKIENLSGIGPNPEMGINEVTIYAQKEIFIAGTAKDHDFVDYEELV